MDRVTVCLFAKRLTNQTLFSGRSGYRNLVRLYGRAEVVAAIARANEYQTYDR